MHRLTRLMLAETQALRGCIYALGQAGGLDTARPGMCVLGTLWDTPRNTFRSYSLKDAYVHQQFK